MIRWYINEPLRLCEGTGTRFRRPDDRLLTGHPPRDMPGGTDSGFSGRMLTMVIHRGVGFGRRSLWGLSLALAALASSGCGGPEGENGGSATSGDVRVDGSSTVYPISLAAQEAFSLENPRAGSSSRTTAPAAASASTTRARPTSSTPPAPPSRKKRKKPPLRASNGPATSSVTTVSPSS